LGEQRFERTRTLGAQTVETGGLCARRRAWAARGPVDPDSPISTQYVSVPAEFIVLMQY
jgi:hypothetical protein